MNALPTDLNVERGNPAEQIRAAQTLIQNNPRFGFAVVTEGPKSRRCTERTSFDLVAGRVMGDLKRMVGDEAVSVGESASPDPVTPNPMDALNRRDIEIIKRSLVNMHKDNAELRGAMIALHGRSTAAPSRLFFVSLGVIMLIVVGAVTIARPQIDASLSRIPALARLSGSPVTR